jgi:hypothetical protein
MTINEFREMALEIPNAIERSHMNHPDFRVAGKVFASLGVPDENWAMVSSANSSKTRLRFSNRVAARGDGKVRRMFIFLPRKRALCALFSKLLQKTLSRKRKRRIAQRRLGPALGDGRYGAF